MMHFVKLEGIGNDYIYLDAVSEPALGERADLPELARRMSDRHMGVGGDGIILVCRPSETAQRAVPPADVRMRMFNADGSESEMCGNGVRCVAKFAHDRLGVLTKPMRVETGRGVLVIDYEVKGSALVRATVDMGAPILELTKIPVRVEEAAWSRDQYVCVETPDGGVHIGVCVSMGNPHFVMFSDENEALFEMGIEAIELERIGARIETHAAFPNRVNVHVVKVASDAEATMRTWERGTGITLACGTGACAVHVAGVLTGRLAGRSLLHLPGGDLEIQWAGDGASVFKTGPATDVFEGEWPE
jgi:diaminopimelate epimerase